MYFQGSVFWFQFGKRYLAHLFSLTKILIDYNGTIIFEIIIHFFSGANSNFQCKQTEQPKHLWKKPHYLLSCFGFFHMYDLEVLFFKFGNNQIYFWKYHFSSNISLSNLAKVKFDKDINQWGKTFSWYQSQKKWCHCNSPVFYYMVISSDEFLWKIYHG